MGSFGNGFGTGVFLFLMGLLQQVAFFLFIQFVQVKKDATQGITSSQTCLHLFLCEATLAKDSIYIIQPHKTLSSM